MKTFYNFTRRTGKASLLAGLFAVPAVALAGIPIQSGHSGSWYNFPARDGEGFLLEVDQNDRLVAYWFTYDAQGGQQWVVGEGPASGDDQNRVTVPVVVTSGAMFGDDFDPADVVRTTWGTLMFEFSSCDEATVTYESVVGFGSGTISLTPLTVLRNSACEVNAANVLGTYRDNVQTGGAQFIFNNCSDPSQNRTLVADSFTLVIEGQSGADITGTVEFQATAPPDLVVDETGEFQGTVQENGSIQASFNTSRSIADQPDGGTSGTFTALFGNSGVRAASVLGVGTDANDQTCDVFALVNLLDAAEAPQP